MKKWITSAIFCLTPWLLSAQEWQRTDKVDTFSNQKYTEFTLAGKFLTRPQNAQFDTPLIVMDCIPGERKYAGKWYFRGGLMNAHINTGTIVNSMPEGVGVWYRRDDGNASSAIWSKSTDGTALFPSAIQLDEILYGHDLIHKEGTTPPVRKLILMADEYLAARIVMEFDLPDSQDVYDACGLMIHQK